MDKPTEGDDCPECRKVRELEQELHPVMDRSDLSPVNKANTLLVFAIAELFYLGSDAAKRELGELMASHFRKLDAVLSSNGGA